MRSQITTEESTGQSYVAYCDRPVYYQDMVRLRKATRHEEEEPEVSYEPSIRETEDEEVFEENAVNGGLRRRDDALWAILGFVFNCIRRFIFVVLYGFLPKAKAEMGLVARFEETCDADVDELPLVEITPEVSYWYLLALTAMTMAVGAAIGYWFGGRRYKLALEDAREYAGTLMDRVQNLVTQLEIRMNEITYVDMWMFWKAQWIVAST